MNHKVILILLVVNAGEFVLAADAVEEVIEKQPSYGGGDTENITSFDYYLDVFNKRYLAKYRIERRKNAFEMNLEDIASHNLEFQEGNSQFQMGVNIFADLDNELYKKQMVRMRDTNHRKMDVDINDEMVGAPQGMPSSLDWREKGFKTELVNQKTCGSCYAFSISYAITAQILRRIGRMEFVSQQQMVDCSVETGNQGCAGGSLRYTLKYLEQCGGVMREGDYPYTSSQGKCNFNKDYAIVNISEWAIMPKNEEGLAFALWKIGPIAVSLNAAPKSFQLYKTGIYDDETACDNSKVNHAMLLVGYTPTYWILKNWWGGWGEQGYMRIARGRNMCGISNYAAYVTIQ